jgi:DNA-binding protein YbaB
MMWIVCGLVLVSAGCKKDVAPVDVDPTEVNAIAKDILQAISAGNVKLPYEKYFSPEFRDRTSPAEWADIANGYRNRLGKFLSLKPHTYSATRIEGSIEGSFSYLVEWEKGPGLLVLNVSREDEWEVTSLKIDSQIIKDVDDMTIPTTLPKTAPAIVPTPATLPVLTTPTPTTMPAIPTTTPVNN